MRAGTRLVASLAAAWCTTAAPARSERWQAGVEVGGEYDTNVRRVEQDPGAGVAAEATPLARVGGAVTGTGSLGRWGRWAARLGGSVRTVVGEVEGEDVGVVELGARWERPLPARAATLGVRGSWYDAGALAEGGGARTYALGAVDGSLALAGEGGERVAASAGLRSFRYDPDAAYDWDGAALGVRYERAAWEAAVEAAGGEGASSLALALGYRLEARSYRGPALRNGCAPDAPVTPACFVATGAARGDLHHVLDLEATYTGDAVVTAAYALTVDDSSSFGQSLVRHRGAVAATVPLPAALYLTGSVALLFDQYLDPVLLARDVASQGFTSIDDDNRSAAALRLSRVLGAGVTAELRWAFHADSLSSDDLPFRRHVAYAGLVWDSGSGTW